MYSFFMGIWIKLMNLNFVLMYVYFFVCYYSYGFYMEDLIVLLMFLVCGKCIDFFEYFLISELCYWIFIKWLYFVLMSIYNWMVVMVGFVIWLMNFGVYEFLL